MGERIAIVTMGVKIAGETRGYTRYWSLANMAAQAGFEVDLITSRFQHWDKAHRDLDALDLSACPFNLVFIDEPGYARNLSLQRIRSHRHAARNLRRFLQSAKPYRLIYAEIPPNDVALSSARFAAEQGIPFIVDVNDLWPEAMRMVFDVPVISDLLLYPFARDAREVYRRASAVVGTSDEYAARPFADRPADCPPNRSPNRPPNIEALTVYVGNELDEFDAGAAAAASYAAALRDSQTFWVTYAGTLGASYDIATMIRAAALLAQRGLRDIETLILGDGPNRASLEELARTLAAPVRFGGYTPYAEMAACLKASDILVNSLVRKAPQSIVNKIADYLAAGKPLLNTGSSPELRAKIAAQGLGVSIEAENPELLATTIEELYRDPARRSRMAQAARHVAETEFDRKVSYQRIIDLIRRTMC
jgi:glycosyltransferase involved in cell wall biosynthesis